MAAHDLKVHDVLMALAVESECHGIAYPASDADWESLCGYWRPFGVKWHRLERRLAMKHWRSASRRLSLPTVTRDFAGEERIIRDLLAGQSDARLIIDFMSGAPLLRKVRQGVVLSGHDCFSRFFREQGKYAESWRTRLHLQIRRVFALNAERQFAHLADRVHLVSQVDADELQRINPRVKPAVIPLSIAAPPPHKLKPFSQRNERVLWGELALPAILRGMRTLLAEAVHRASGTLKGFLLLGRVPEADARRLLPDMDALGIRYQARVEDLDLFLGNTRLVVLADVSGTGQKTRALDSLAHGCCVVGLSEVFRGIVNDQKTPAFVETTNITELLSKLAEVDVDSSAAIASAGQTLVQKHFSMPALRQRWQALLNSVPPLRLNGRDF
jgi:hypothetical protein